MKVKELINELKKMPQNSIVYYQDFDADPFGISSSPNVVMLLDFDNLSKEEESQNDFKMKGKVVVLRA